MEFVNFVEHCKLFTDYDEVRSTMYVCLYTYIIHNNRPIIRNFIQLLLNADSEDSESFNLQ